MFFLDCLCLFVCVFCWGGSFFLFLLKCDLRNLLLAAGQLMADGSTKQLTGRPHATSWKYSKPKSETQNPKPNEILGRVFGKSEPKVFAWGSEHLIARFVEISSAKKWNSVNQTRHKTFNQNTGSRKKERKPNNGGR